MTAATEYIPAPQECSAEELATESDSSWRVRAIAHDPRPRPTVLTRPALGERWPARSAGDGWPATRLPAGEALQLLEGCPLREGSTALQHRRWRCDAQWLLEWLATGDGETWQQRWLASGAEDSGGGWVELPMGFYASRRGRAATRDRYTVRSGLRGLLTVGVVRPALGWLLDQHVFLTPITDRGAVDPGGFTRLRDGWAQIGGGNVDDLASALNAISAILLAKGGTIADITVGDCLEYSRASLERGRRGSVLFYRLLRDLEVLPGDAPPSLAAALRPGPATPAELIDRYELANAEMREVLVGYLSVRAASLDHSSLRHLATTLGLLFWKDLETYHPGIASLELTAEQAAAWKTRLGRSVRDGGTRLAPEVLLAQVRTFYTDLAQWAAEEPERWGRWAAPCPVRIAETSHRKLRRQRKARMDQRTRSRLPVLPALVRTAEQRKSATAAGLAQAAAVPPGETFTLHGRLLLRLAARPGSERVLAVDITDGPVDRDWHRPPGPSGSGRSSNRPRAAERVVDGIAVGSLRGAPRRDFTVEEDWAFWAWAVIEVLRHTGVRIEELLELSHHSFAAYTLPSTGEVVPLLQIAPSKTDRERVLLVSPELADVLAAVIARVRRGAVTLPLVSRYDHHERVDAPHAPLLFQRRRAGVDRALSRSAVTYVLEQTFLAAGLTDPTGAPVRFAPHDFRRIFATEALREGMPPHIAAAVLGHASLDTTLGYAAIYADDVVAEHRAFLARRRALRPAPEYRTVTPEEWEQFVAHFELRKVALGVCTRDYGTPCTHENACVRCPALRPDPAQRLRLVQILANLRARLTEAHEHGWRGEIAGLEVSLDGAQRTLAAMDAIAARSAPRPPVVIGLPLRVPPAGWSPP